MKLADVRAKAFAMPLNDPCYPKGPYKFYNREFVVITYRTNIDVLREVVPEPLEVASDTVTYEFIRMPDSTGFGDYTETGQVIPVRFRNADGVVQEGGYVQAMYLDDNSPISGGREIWGFPKKLASPKISYVSETVVCTLHYGPVLCVSATVGYKHRELDPAPVLKALARPNFMIKIIPHVDCTPRICELVRYRRLVGPRGHPALRACDVRRGAAARTRSALGQPLYHRPDAWPRRGGPRLI
jgi:acetoacetate decarboxylase